MTAFLKIDDCKTCHRAIPWEWAPAILVRGSPLPGTGVWRSRLRRRPVSGLSEPRWKKEREKNRLALRRREELVAVLGGHKPYQEFTFERYRVLPGNAVAFERTSRFDPACENLYLWGPCGVGKTHLAYAAARRSS